MLKSLAPLSIVLFLVAVHGAIPFDSQPAGDEPVIQLAVLQEPRAAGDVSGSLRAADAARLFALPARLSEAFTLTMPLPALDTEPDTPAAPQPVVHEQTTVLEEPAKPVAPEATKLEPKQVFGLLVRARALLKSNDIAGARLLLERAANAGDASSAYLLAETYDPAKLASDPYKAHFADPAKARLLYERATMLADGIDVTGSISKGARSQCH